MVTLISKKDLHTYMLAALYVYKTSQHICYMGCRCYTRTIYTCNDVSPVKY